MKKGFWSVLSGMTALVGVAVALAAGESGNSPDEPEDDGVVLGEEDLAERAEIRRNMYRRMTPTDLPLVQDVGTWPSAWEEFGTNWYGAAVEREYGALVVPVEVEQTNGATVIRDGTGLELWRGTTDFTRPESAGVLLAGGLVAEEDWARYEGVRGAVEEMTAAASRVDEPGPTRTSHTNGLRFTSCEWTTNDTFHMAFAYEVDTNVEVFAYAVAHTSALVVATWTNDENVAITDTNLVWYPAGPSFNGLESNWELRGTVAIANGTAEFEDTGFANNLGRVRFYAAAVVEDTDGDGLSDGVESFVTHTDANNDDSDHDGVLDGKDTFPNTSNVWFEVVTSTSRYYQVTLDDVGLNAQEVPFGNWSWVVSGQPPTSDSVVQDVHIRGYADDYITVDTTPVDRGQGPRSYNCSLMGVITNLPSLQFAIRLVDWPDPTWTGPNEVRLGSSLSEPFEVEWTWLVPMSLTGPECICVGDTVQFVAAGGGGGPYTWSVESDGLEDVAEIDEEGVLTALAPGIAFVTATAGETYSVTQAVNVVQIDFLTGEDNSPAASLKIAKWDHAFRMFGTNVAVTNNFIDLDSDRFKVRLVDPSQTGAGSLGVLLSTIGSDSAHNDPATAIDLFETPVNSGIFVSTNLLLVADDIDDDFSYSAIPPDNTRNDRTFKTAPGGNVRVQYPEEGGTLCTKIIPVPLEKTLHIIPVIMRNKPSSEWGTPLIFVSQVEDILAVARERFAQIGVELTWTPPEIRDPPAGMSMMNAFVVRDTLAARVLSDDAKALIAEVGTVGNTNDLHVIFVQNLLAGTGDLIAASVSDFRYENSEDDYLFNVFVDSLDVQNPEYGGYILAHELGHLLTDAGHEQNDKWRLMYTYTETRGVAGTRRLADAEETTIRNNGHVH